jgi:hypothetical protein
VNSRPVVALADVREDVQVACDYFETRVGATGEGFLRRYFATTEKIALNPWSYPIKFDDYHRALVPRSCFAIYYFQEAARSVIVAVIDARRHPCFIRDLVRTRRPGD